MAYAQERLYMFMSFFLSALIVLLCLSVPKSSQAADENVQLQEYDADAAVTCLDNFTYVAGEGCALSEGRVNNFRLDGNSSVFGFGQCLPQSIGPEEEWSVDPGFTFDVGDGNVIALITEANGSFKFKKVTKDIIDNPNESLPSSETYIHNVNAAAGEQGGQFIAFNNYATENLNESLEMTLYSANGVPLNAERWLFTLLLRSQVTGYYYNLGVIYGPEGEMEPSDNALPGTTGVFPISYAGPLQSLGAEQPVWNGSNSTSTAALLDPSTGEPSGKFVAVWTRPKEAGGNKSLVYGQIFDEAGEMIGSDFGGNFGEKLLQDPNLQAASGSGSYFALPRLTSLSNGGFALGYRDAIADKFQVQLFDQNGNPVDGGNILGGENDSNNGTSNVVKELQDNVIAFFTRDGNSGDNIYTEVWDISTPSSPTQLVASTLLHASGNTYLGFYDPMPIETDRNKVMLFVRELNQAGNALVDRMYFVSFNGTDTISKAPQWVKLNQTGIFLDDTTGRSTIIYDTEAIGGVNYIKFFHIYANAANEYVLYNYSIADCW